MQANIGTIITFAFFAIYYTECSRMFQAYPKVRQYPISGFPGVPVFITPYVESGDIQQGQNASFVPSLVGNVKSYAGFITVNKVWNSNLFFWFFPSENKPDNAPVLLWLQGGPGVSSLYGLFEQNGPFYVAGNGLLHKRDYTWTKDFNVLYIDNPIGTGFSFAQNDKGYSKNQQDIANNLHAALVQFFQFFPQLAKNDFYLTGESYAGKYIPSTAYAILKKNPAAKVKINLKGMCIGSGFTDPENMMVYSDYAFQAGLINANDYAAIGAYEDSIKVEIQSGNYVEAHKLWDDLLTVIEGAGISVYDYTYSGDSSYTTSLDEFIQRDYIRNAIHVGPFLYHDVDEVYDRMVADIMQSVAPLFPELLQHYKILFYNGQFDLIVGYPLTRNFLRSLKFADASNYHNAVRKPWYVEKELAGYYTKTKNLTEILVRDAGHLVPADQPKWTYDIIKNFVAGKLL